MKPANKNNTHHESAVKITKKLVGNSGLVAVSQPCSTPLNSDPDCSTDPGGCD